MRKDTQLLDDVLNHFNIRDRETLRYLLDNDWEAGYEGWTPDRIVYDKDTLYLLTEDEHERRQAEQREKTRIWREKNPKEAAWNDAMFKSMTDSIMLPSFGGTSLLVGDMGIMLTIGEVGIGEEE